MLAMNLQPRTNLTTRLPPRLLTIAASKPPRKWRFTVESFLGNGVGWADNVFEPTVTPNMRDVPLLCLYQIIICNLSFPACFVTAVSVPSAKVRVSGSAQSVFEDVLARVVAGADCCTAPRVMLMFREGLKATLVCPYLGLALG